MMKVFASILIIASCAVVLSGCGSKDQEEKGYTKKDFEKTAPPQGFINSAPKGPSSGPPAGATPGK